MGADSFDCCSSFRKCSDALECVHKDNPIFDVCTYRKKLEAGIIFYGKNRNVFEPIRNGVLRENSIHKKKDKRHPKVYLTCYKRPFAVLSRSNFWSYQLDEEKYKIITDKFTLKEIPFRTSLDMFEDLPGNEIEITGPCNSRVVFKIEDMEFHILNFNSYLIQNWYAEKINKSLISKGIESRVELIGSFTGVNSEVISITKNIDSIAPVKSPIVNTNHQFVPIQLTLFDSTEFAAPAYRRR